MKFGVKVPLTVEEALSIDKQNGNILWQDGIEKEMKNSHIAFEVLDKNAYVTVSYTEITCRLIFGIKMDITQKARYIAGGHLTDPPSSMNYASVVGLETVRIALLVAATNDINILAGDIHHAYLNAEKK